MLEYNLIQQHKPRFNIRYRDDKSYPYLALTVGEKWPRAQVLRGTKRKGVRYFGPYGHTWAIRDTLDALTRVFPVRTCSNAFFDQRAREAAVPVLRHRTLRRPLRARNDGRHRGVVPSPRRGDGRVLAGMRGPCSAGWRHRCAPLLRARSSSRRRASATSSSGTASARVPGDGAHAARGFDVVALVEDDLEAAVQVFYVRGGRVLGRGWVVDRVEDLDRAGSSPRSSSSCTCSARRCRRGCWCRRCPRARSSSRHGCRPPR